MKIVVGVAGSRGDVLPFISLATQLQQRGYGVTLVAPEKYRSLAMKHQIVMVSCGEGFEAYLEESRNQGDRSEGLVRRVALQTATQFVSLKDATRDATAIIGAPLLVAGPSIAELCSIPYVTVIRHPWLLSREHYPLLAITEREVSGLFGAMRHKNRRQQWDEIIGEALNRERANHHLPAVQDLYQHLFQSGQVVAALDAELSPPPTGVRASGLLYHHDPLALEPEVQRQVSEGKPPVYFATVSEDVAEPVNLLKRLCETALSLGHRAVIGSSWKGIQPSDLPKECFIIDDDAVFGWLSSMSAVIHSGSTGISTAATIAGVPQVAIPYLRDQTYWASRITEIGIGPTSPGEYSLREVGSALKQTLSDPKFRIQAQQWGQKLQAKQSVSAVADAVETALL
jgi:vancomycin aglycone glucosyltransferase